MTKQERESAAIAKALVKALERIEKYNGDPIDVLEDAVIYSRLNRGVSDVVEALRKYYLADG